MKLNKILLIIGMIFPLMFFGQKTGRKTIKNKKLIERKKQLIPSVYEKLLSEKTLTFKWEVEDNTELKENDIIKKKIDIDIKESTISTEETSFPMVYDSRFDYETLTKFQYYKVKIEKDTVILTNDDGIYAKYKLILDTEKTKIVKIQDINTKEVYDAI